MATGLAVRLCLLMRASVEPVEANKVRLSVELDDEEFEKALDSTYRKLARQVKVPGFRPGKAPRRILEARIGVGAVRGEAIEDAIPGYYAQALQESDVEPISAPEIDVTSGQDEGPVSFDAVVEVRPQVNIAGYQGLRVTIPSPEVTDEQVEAQLDRLREQFGELSEVSRPAKDGDHLSIDIKGYRHSEVVEGLTADDYMYEVGSGRVVPELDENIRGAKPGDIFKFNATVGEEEISFQVLVKDVKEKLLPEVTDEWANEASEFDTAEELREDIGKRLAAVRRMEIQLTLREGTVEALGGLVSEDLPRALVGEELERRVHELSHRLQEQNMSMEDYLRATGGDQAKLAADLQEAAERSVRADLALRALADAESVEISDEELDQEIERSAERIDKKPAELRAQLERAGRLSELRSDLRSSKALNRLMEQIELVDAEGHVIERSRLELAEAGAEAQDSDDEDQQSAETTE